MIHCSTAKTRIYNKTESGKPLFKGLPANCMEVPSRVELLSTVLQTVT